MSKATETQWRVQVRRSRAHKWVNKGLFETRAGARLDAQWLRDGILLNGKTGREEGPYGFGNTRIVPYVKAVK